MNHQKRADIFCHWFSRSGHWVHEYRADAVRAWGTHGIIGLPDATPQALEIVKAWADQDPLPAMVARWNAERVTAP